MSYIIIETHGGAEHASICVNEEGTNVVFAHRELDEAEEYRVKNCQEGIIVQI